jgi:small subunit ribosomal protein S17
MSENTRQIGGFKTGRVVSNSMQKTVVVEVERLTAHPLYKRTLRRTKRFLAHDEKQECKLGDVVSIRECRPLSRRKRWRVHAILRHGTARPAELEALEKRLKIEGTGS